ncbi:MAG: tetratricopeptide repeat protein [Polyangiaceae bacterium]|nr:tetratricopeptide repeat protein [Polyangiaceae bacterium]
MPKGAARSPALASTAREQLKAALRAVRQGELRAALDQLDAVIASAPDEPEVRLLRARLRARAGVRGARADLRHALDRAAPGSDVHAHGAAVLEQLGLYADAADAQALAPRSLAGLRKQAELCSRAGRLHEAIALRREAAALAPGDPRVAIELSEQLAALGGVELAFDALGSLGDDSPDVWLRRGRLLVELGRLAAAADVARRAASLPTATAEQLVATAELLLSVGEHDDAVALATRIADATPRAALLQARAANCSGRYVEARAFAERALVGDDAEALCQRGIARWLLGDAEGAGRDLDQARERAPGLGEAWIWSSEVSLRRGDVERAVEEVTVGIERTKGYPLGAHVAQIAIHARRRRPEPSTYRELLALLRPVLEALGFSPLDAPSAEELRARLAAVLAALRGNRGATPTFMLPAAGGGERLTALVLPRHARFLARDVQERIRVTAVETVLAELEALAAERPLEPTILCHRGEIELWLGRYDAAERSFSRALGVASDTRWAYVGLCAAALLGGRLQEAIEWCARAEAVVVPGRTQYVYRGEAHRRLGDLTRARDDLARDRALTPSRISGWLNEALLEPAPQRLREVWARVWQRAPGLATDACVERGVEPEQAVDEPERLVALFEHVLTMMRGNRSSNFVTYFTAGGQLRFVPHGRG